MTTSMAPTRFLLDPHLLAYPALVHEIDKQLFKFGHEIYQKDQVEASLFIPSRHVPFDPEAGRQGAQRLKTWLGKDFPSLIYACASQDPERYHICHTWLKRLIAQGRDRARNLNDPDIYAFHRTQHQVSRERHRYLGLVRFRELQGGALYAELAPKHHIVPLIAPHFVRRLGHRPFALADQGRNWTFVYDGQDFHEGVLTDLLPDSSQEDAFARLWQDYWANIAIDSRKNRGRMQGNMPKYTWNYLTEMQNRHTEIPSFQSLDKGKHEN